MAWMQVVDIRCAWRTGTSCGSLSTWWQGNRLELSQSPVQTTRGADCWEPAMQTCWEYASSLLQDVATNP